MKAAQVLLAGTAATSNQLYSMDITAVEEYLAGVIYGMIEKDDLPEMQKCLKNTETVAAEVKAIVNEVAKGDLADVIKGVQDAVKLIQELPTDLSDCKDIQGDVQKIKTWGDELLSPGLDLLNITLNVFAVTEVSWELLDKLDGILDTLDDISQIALGNLVDNGLNLSGDSLGVLEAFLHLWKIILLDHSIDDTSEVLLDTGDAHVVVLGRGGTSSEKKLSGFHFQFSF